MKLRIKGNSIRIRVSRPEVNRFCEEGYLEDRTDFGNSALIYALQGLEGIPGLSADFAEGRIVMHVPADVQKVWATNEIVGYNNTLELSSGGNLFLLLEKDFKCIDAPSYEDQSDNYDNPNQTC